LSTPRRADRAVIALTTPHAALPRPRVGVIVWAMRAVGIVGCSFALLLFIACGGSQRPSELSPTSNTSADTPDPPSAEAKPASDAAANDDAKPASDDAESDAPKKPSADVPAPQFKENGSVLDAINAVPQGTPRLNIEQVALGRPLNNPELYEPCKPGTSHFKAKVAIWDGKAVGLDLTTTPKNPKFGACVADRIRSITWPDKVKSLNVVEYTF
jgi:hypothetical protein